jgi:hypothetical protein
VNCLAVVILLVWVVSVTISFFDHSYQIPQSIQGAFGLLTGAVFAKTALVNSGFGDPKGPRDASQ